MGSRITFPLSACLQNPDVSVVMEYLPVADGVSEHQQVARIAYSGPAFSKAIFQYSWDVDVTPEGHIELSGDFNFFRDRVLNERTLRFFYEAGIQFTITH